MYVLYYLCQQCNGKYTKAVFKWHERTNKVHYFLRLKYRGLNQLVIEVTLFG